MRKVFLGTVPLKGSRKPLSGFHGFCRGIKNSDSNRVLGSN